MPRTISSLLREAINAPQTGAALLMLLRLSHPRFTDTIRIVRDGKDLVSRGHTYQRFPFECGLPRESDEAPPRLTLRICNVDRSIISQVRDARAGGGEPIAVELELVLAATPDTVEAGPLRLSIRRITYDALVISGELRYEDLLDEPYPAAKFSPSRAPGLH